MTGRVFKQKKNTGAARMAVYVAVVVVCVLLVYFGLSSLGQTQSGEQIKVSEDAIVRAAVQCYALESRFPESLDYLEQNYGLALDREHYVYHYRAIGSNLMPEIEVYAND